MFCVFQVVERLEADLGVQVQELYIPQLKYSFQIWGAMMSLADEDGKVCVCVLWLCDPVKKDELQQQKTISGPTPVSQQQQSDPIMGTDSLKMGRLKIKKTCFISSF